MKHFMIALMASSLVGLALAQPPRSSSPPSTFNAAPRAGSPRLVPVAETKLLMEGMTHANFLGLERILKRDDAIDEASWKFARGQALLIAESGNLLMLRPPKNSGQEAWMKSAGELRERAGQLGRVVSTRDVEGSRRGLVQLANTCNKCHETFRVTARISPFEAEKP